MRAVGMANTALAEWERDGRVQWRGQSVDESSGVKPAGRRNQFTRARATWRLVWDQGPKGSGAPRP